MLERVVRLRAPGSLEEQPVVVVVVVGRVVMLLLVLSSISTRLAVCLVLHHLLLPVHVLTLLSLSASPPEKKTRIPKSVFTYAQPLIKVLSPCILKSVFT